jgi:type IV secretion system protein VirB9
MRSFWLGLGIYLMAWGTAGAMADDGFKSYEVEESSITTIYAKVGYTVVIEFPDDEEIVSAPIGDGAAVPPGQTIDALPTWEEWPVGNTISIKPTLKRAETSLIVVTKTGDRRYTVAFRLLECSCSRPDIKVQIVRPKPSRMLDPTAPVVASLRHDIATRDGRITELETAVAAAEKKLRVSEENVLQRADPEELMGTVNADYHLGKHAAEPPFLVAQVFNDGTSTRIKCSSLEPPAFYELKDGKLSLVDYKYRNGTYVIPKIVDEGALRIGKKELKFYREPSHAGRPEKTTGTTGQ